MREFSVPATAKVGPDEALTDLLAKNVAEVGDQTGFRVRRDGAWQDVTWQEFGDEVAGVAKGLIAAGVEPGDRVALMAQDPLRVDRLDFAIWTAGAVTVPVYETSSAEQVAVDPRRLRRGRAVVVETRRARRGRRLGPGRGRPT